MKTIKQLLFLSFFIIIFAEQIQFYFPLIKADALCGSYNIPPKPLFTLDNWLGGNYQDSLMKNYEYDMSLHVPFVRLRNQIGYSLFDEVKANGVEEGKNHHLYSIGHVYSLFGKDFIGEEKVIDRVTKLAFVQQELKKRNIDLLCLVAPTKPSIMPEYLPEKYDLSKIKKSNYDAYLEQFDKNKINYIDFKKYFLNLKPTTKHALFAKLGVHWSGYGATIAADTLINYMQQIRNIKMINHYQLSGTTTRIPRDTDHDMAVIMNLINEIPSDTLYYPNIVFVKDRTKTKPNVLIIGDSYVWSWIGFYPYFKNVFDSNSCYWYYNHDLAYTNGKIPANTQVSDFNINEETLHRDFIILVYNESTLVNFGNDFIEQMYDMFQKENNSEKNRGNNQLLKTNK